jgi:DNA-binding NarL/FixJ family response regulator
MRNVVRTSPRVCAQPSRTEPPVGAASLTPRETEVLEHLKLGESYEEIAKALHIEVETVRTHTARISRKLRVPSRWTLLGLLEPLGLSSWSTPNRANDEGSGVP